MRKEISIFLALVALAAICAPILSLYGCNENGSDETSAESTAQSADTSTPDSGEPVDSTVADETTGPIIISPPSTQPPPDVLSFSVLANAGVKESLTDFFTEDEGQGELLRARSDALVKKHGIALSESSCSDIVLKVKNDLASGAPSYELLMLDTGSAMQLICSASLEDVSEVGIEITHNTAGVDSGVSESLTVAGRTYLFVTDATTSHIEGAYALLYREGDAELSSDPVELALSGNLTFEKFMAYSTEIHNTDGGNSLYIENEKDHIFAYLALGGELFTSSESKMPSPATSGNSFQKAYTAAYSLSMQNTDKSGATFELLTLSQISEGEVYLPLPKLGSDGDYITPVDTRELCYFAAPLGVENGQKLRRAVTALAEESEEIARAEKNKSISTHASAAQLLEIILENKRVDLGMLFGWGDLDELLAHSLANQVNKDELMAQKTLRERMETVSTAVSIIAQRLGVASP